MVKMGKLTMLLLILVAFCAINRPVQAQTSIYVFDPNQSIVIRSGGIAGIQKTFSITGQFLLSVDSGANVASFEIVDANLTDEIGTIYVQNLDEIFNMTDLAGIVVAETTIEFEGKTADGTESNVRLKLSLSDDSVHLTGKTIPPPNSADMFFYDLDAVATKKYAAGTGEPNNPYKIATAEDLILLGETPEDYDKHFKLMADIDLGDYAPDKFNFIGEFIPFTGVFDGNGHSISNFHYTDGDRSPLSGGLFSMVADPNAQIRNLTLIDPNICGKVHVGPLVGWMQEGAITNCHVIGGCVNEVFPALVTDDIGGLVGLVDRGTVSGCTSSCRVNGHNSVGGLVGYAGKTDGGGCFITNCRATGDVTGESLVGGLVGIGPHSIIICSCATGQVAGGWQVGGLAGSSGGSVTGRYISDCYATGSVAGKHVVGGLIGSHGNIPISRCYAAGRVINLSDEPDISQHYIGGLIGSEDHADSTCFWDIETSGRTTSKGGIGLTTAEMQTASTFLEAGWDFVGETKNGTEDIWWIFEGRDYPRLSWEQVLVDDFEDGAALPLWQVYEPDFEKIRVEETNGRLEVHADNTADDVVAGYISSGWRLDVTSDFALRADFHFSKIAAGDSWVMILLLPSLDEPVGRFTVLEAGCLENQPFYLHEIDENGLIIQGTSVSRSTDDGTLYISYNSDMDEIYLSFTGFGKTKAWQTAEGLLQNQWAAQPVYVVIGGGSDQVVLDAGDAYLDNFIIYSGILDFSAAVDDTEAEEP